MATKKTCKLVDVNISEPELMKSRDLTITHNLVESERMLKEDILPSLQNIYNILFNDQLPAYEIKDPECVRDSCTNIFGLLYNTREVLKKLNEGIG